MVDKIGSVGLPSPIREPNGTVPPRATDGGLAFDQILQQQIGSAGDSGVGGVRFSAHAQQRLAQAAVQLGPQAMSRLEAAVDKAGLKGGKESLILLDDLAFVVSVKNRTVITAVGADRMADNVFTKIDSVVIAKDRNEPDPAMGELATLADSQIAPVLRDAQSAPGIDPVAQRAEQAQETK